MPFWVCLSVVFSQVSAFVCSNAVSWSIYVERFWIKCVMIPKLSVIRAVHCSLWENEPGSNSVHIVVVCSSVALEENLVNGTLAALLAHSQSCRMKSIVEIEQNLVWTCCKCILLL